MHLSLGDSGGPLGRRIERAPQRFVSAVEQDIPAEELEQARQTLSRLAENAENLVQKGDRHE